jgi:hypothetical protein
MNQLTFRNRFLIYLGAELSVKILMDTCTDKQISPWNVRPYIRYVGNACYKIVQRSIFSAKIPVMNPK